MANASWRDGYPSLTYDKLRYADTDRQGHVNNAVFATFLETGRVELLYDPERSLHREGAEFVIVSLKLDMQGEIRWPGRVDIGTRVLRIGRSSFTLDQGIFQHDQRVATAETVIVQIDQTSRTSTPLDTDAITRLEELRLPKTAATGDEG